MSQRYLTIITLLLSSLLATACTTYNCPISIDQLQNSSEGPTGGFALALIPLPPVADKLRISVEITLRDQDKQIDHVPRH